MTARVGGRRGRGLVGRMRGVHGVTISRGPRTGHRDAVPFCGPGNARILQDRSLSPPGLSRCALRRIRGTDGLEEILHRGVTAEFRRGIEDETAEFLAGPGDPAL